MITCYRNNSLILTLFSYNSEFIIRHPTFKMHHYLEHSEPLLHITCDSDINDINLISY